MTMPTLKTTDSPLSPMQKQMLTLLSDHQWHRSRELSLKVTHNARDVIRNGADCVAVISAVLSDPTRIREATQSLLQDLQD